MPDLLGTLFDALDIGTAALNSDDVNDALVIDNGPSRRHAQPVEQLGQVGWVTSWQSNAQWAWAVTVALALDGGDDIPWSDVWMQAMRASRYSLVAATGQDPRVVGAMRVGAALNFAYDHPDMILRLGAAGSEFSPTNLVIRASGEERMIPGIVRLSPQEVRETRMSANVGNSNQSVRGLTLPSTPSGKLFSQMGQRRRKTGFGNSLPVPQGTVGTPVYNSEASERRPRDGEET